MPATISVVLRGMEDTEINRLPEVLLDFERQLNNLKIVSEAIPIEIYPRFHIAPNLEDYRFFSEGSVPHKRTDTSDDLK